MNIYNYLIETPFPLGVQGSISTLGNILKGKYNFFIEIHNSNDLEGTIISVMDLNLSQEDISKLEDILSRYKAKVKQHNMINESREEVVKDYREKFGIS